MLASSTSHPRPRAASLPFYRFPASASVAAAAGVRLRPPPPPKGSDDHCVPGPRWRRLPLTPPRTLQRGLRPPHLDPLTGIRRRRPPSFAGHKRLTMPCRGSCHAAADPPPRTHGRCARCMIPTRPPTVRPPSRDWHAPPPPVTSLHARSTVRLSASPSLSPLFPLARLPDWPVIPDTDTASVRASLGTRRSAPARPPPPPVAQCPFVHRASLPRDAHSAAPRLTIHPTTPHVATPAPSAVAIPTYITSARAGHL
jgi:hypothetical protein